MAKRGKQAEFVKWFGPLLDALRDLGDSGKPREVSEKIAETLNLPDSLIPMAFFTVGYPLKTIKAPKRKKLNDIIYNLTDK